jgi:G3E family GTPase
MLSQIEFADAILLNKCNLLGGKKSKSTEEVAQLVHKLNPEAKIYRTVNSRIDLSNIINTGLFNMEKACTSAGWLRELSKDPASITEQEKYGVSSFVFRSKRAFHPERLSEILDGFGRLSYDNTAKETKNEQNKPLTEKQDNSDLGLFHGVIRSKGMLWLANADAYPMNFHTAGREVTIDPSVETPFLAAVPEKLWDEDAKAHVAELKKKKSWDAKVGDRESEIVCIGLGLDKQRMMSQLKAACLTDEEIRKGPNFWRKLSDPFFDGKVEAYFEFHPMEEDDEEGEEKKAEDASGMKKQ